MSASDTPKLYLACLACYGAGSLHGHWVSCDDDADGIQEAAREAFRVSRSSGPCASSEPEDQLPEVAVHYHRGFRGAWSGEHFDAELASRLAALLGEHGKAAAALLSSEIDMDLDRAEEILSEGYSDWDWGSSWEYSFDRYEGLGHDMSEFPWTYVDWEKVHRDAVLNSEFRQVEHDGRVWIFESVS